MTEIAPEIRERLEGAAKLYEQAAEELETAAAHARRAAEHFRNGDVPRGTANRRSSIACARRCDRERHEPGSLRETRFFLLTNVFQTARSSASSAAVGSH